jgi:hypothetical protein
VSAAAHFVELKFVHDFTFGRFMNVFLGQINDLLGLHAARHLQSPHFAEIVFVLVSDDVAAGEALDRDDHVGLLDWIVLDCCVGLDCVGLHGFLIVVLYYAIIFKSIFKNKEQ